jgi:hypothetical protein
MNILTNPSSVLRRLKQDHAVPFHSSLNSNLDRSITGQFPRWKSASRSIISKGGRSACEPALSLARSGHHTTISFELCHQHETRIRREFNLVGDVVNVSACRGDSADPYLAAALLGTVSGRIQAPLADPT